MTGQISLDPDVGTLVGSELIPVVSSGVNKRTTPAEISTYLATIYRAIFANGQLPGTATNDSAASGNVGELISATLASGSAVALTTSTTANVISISLPAGDWDVWGTCAFSFAGTTTATLLLTSVNTVSATNQTLASGVAIEQAFASFHPAADYSVPSGIWPVKLSTTTTVYLTATAAFATSTAAAYGTIYARRRR